MKQQKKCSVIAAAVSLALVFLFMAVASGFNSAWGNVAVRDVYYPSSEGTMLHGQLFLPKGVSSANPAPAILNMHGGSDYLQMVGTYSIELARRGYVVLSVDAYGSGSSAYLSGGAAANAGGSGKENNSALKLDGGVSTGLEQLLTYKFVDQENIGMIGHSMGGTYVANAALEYASHIKAIMPWGSGSFVDKMKASDSADFTFNVGYINAECDEMVVFATQAETSELLKDPALKAFVGTDEDIVAGKTYGSFADGTARVIYTPDTTHVGNIINRDSIGSLVTFFAQAMPTGSALGSSDQVWMYKEVFGALAVAALLAFIISAAFILLRLPVFAELTVCEERPAVQMSGGLKLAGILICVAVPALTLHWAGLRLAGLKPNALFPMNWANSVAGLAVVNGLILLALLLMISIASYYRIIPYLLGGASIATYALCTFLATEIFPFDFLPAYAIAFVGLGVMGARMNQTIRDISVENNAYRTERQSMLELFRMDTDQLTEFIHLARQKELTMEQTETLLELLDAETCQKLTDAITENIRAKTIELAKLEEKIPGLTPAEKEVCICILKGKSLAQTVKELGKSPSNITNVRSRIRRKLNLEHDEDLQSCLTQIIYRK